MANIIDIPFVGQSYHLKDWAVDCQRTLNLYPQAVESGNAPQVSALLPTPGLIAKYELSGPVRGLYPTSIGVLAVVGTQLFLLGETAEQIGEVVGENIVSFADNRIDVLIVGDPVTYAFKQSSKELRIIAGGGFLGATDATFLDSRFIVLNPESDQVQWSGLLNTEFSALGYATAEANSDKLVRIFVQNGQLWLIGERTTEIWHSTGNADQPFLRVSGAYINCGCIAKNSLAQFGTGLIWLSQTDVGQGQVVITEGYQVKRISNHAMEQEFASYERLDDAVGYSYQQEGHSFYMLSFPTANKTWCFDGSTGMWHERSFYNLNSQHERHRSQVHCFYKGKHYVGDHSNGIIYELSLDAETDNGRMIMRERTTPVINPKGQRLIFDALEIFVQAGQHVNREPIVMLDWSDDQGQTWSFDQQETLGKVGEGKKRVIFRRLGQAFNRVFRLRVTDSSRLIITGAQAKVR
ncbi:packaged DNA stabilization protein [Acinetobacter baumannii]|uniref:packaged DNA stabilization protein n=1 Tax=Acinetobacter baumannii TaxID=470 RepID=UPI002242C9CC|nr:packaged DNA stabilization protein [Acinetobacter baumannii]MCW8533609.1 packaged DNA stabilization protein [Acinetobacter baumannii]MCW8537348.1 packaged DNA stabilization protein [Acinetobacter baumannii]MCW8544779.1 packaged DNA stabilization protein [Acinetobacter baumannii]MCW8548547.1 packaged DNA stabilization protein [Acinetobacter baumannii]MCW8559394.1 packaged DNA stabilization protein [Acinetobacter baumannii]